MPWTCPSCRQKIRHQTDNDRPRPGVIYRCEVCRLNLVFNPTDQRLVARNRDQERPRK